MSDRHRLPSLFQINTRTWLTELGSASGEGATFDAVPESALDEIAALGFDWVWMMGVWQTGHTGHEIAGDIPELRRVYQRVLPDFSDKDICGSPFAVQNYHVHGDFGGDEALARFRERLSKRGLKLMLDFVPNHTAIDHPWAYQHPRYYIQGSEGDIEKSPETFRRVETSFGERILAHGRDPYYPAWTDTLQLNYRHPELRREMIAVLKHIAEMCDGVRCDVAMLLLPDVIHKTWGDRSLPKDGSKPVDDSFWSESIPKVKQTAPEFLFMAEVYWNLEWKLQEQGFDYTYDKPLYDRLKEGSAPPIQQHLTADLDYQRRLARFLENHDEERAAHAFPGDMGPAAAVLCYLAPGLRFFHQGQLEGRKVHVPVQLCRRPQEVRDEALYKFYRGLLKLLERDVLRRGHWRMLENHPIAPDDPSWRHFIAYAWYSPQKAEIKAATQAELICVVNYNLEEGRCLLKPWEGEISASLSLDPVISSGDDLEPPHLDLGSDLLQFNLPAWGFQVLEIKLRKS